MFELSCDGERASWPAFLRVTAEQFVIQSIRIVSPFDESYLTKNGK